MKLLIQLPWLAGLLLLLAVREVKLSVSAPLKNSTETTSKGTVTSTSPSTPNSQAPSKASIPADTGVKGGVSNSTIGDKAKTRSGSDSSNLPYRLRDPNCKADPNATAKVLNRTYVYKYRTKDGQIHYYNETKHFPLKPVYFVQWYETESGKIQFVRIRKYKVPALSKFRNARRTKVIRKTKHVKRGKRSVNPQDATSSKSDECSVIESGELSKEEFLKRFKLSTRKDEEFGIWKKFHSDWPVENEFLVGGIGGKVRPAIKIFEDKDAEAKVKFVEEKEPDVKKPPKMPNDGEFIGIEDVYSDDEDGRESSSSDTTYEEGSSGGDATSDTETEYEYSSSKRGGNKGEADKTIKSEEESSTPKDLNIPPEWESVEDNATPNVVETYSTSELPQKSRLDNEEGTFSSSRRKSRTDSPDDDETYSRSRRKYIPADEETSSTLRRKSRPDNEETETSSTSRRKSRPDKEETETSSTSRRKSRPDKEETETSSTSRRKSRPDKEETETSSTSRRKSRPDSQDDEEIYSTSRRKYIPADEVTSSKTRKRGRPGPSDDETSSTSRGKGKIGPAGQEASSASRGKGRPGPSDDETSSTSRGKGRPSSSDKEIPSTTRRKGRPANDNENVDGTSSKPKPDTEKAKRTRSQNPNEFKDYDSRERQALIRILRRLIRSRRKGDVKENPDEYEANDYEDPEYEYYDYEEDPEYEYYDYDDDGIPKGIRKTSNATNSPNKDDEYPEDQHKSPDKFGQKGGRSKGGDPDLESIKNSKGDGIGTKRTRKGDGAESGFKRYSKESSSGSSGTDSGSATADEGYKSGLSGGSTGDGSSRIARRREYLSRRNGGGGTRYRRRYVSGTSAARDGRRLRSTGFNRNRPARYATVSGSKSEGRYATYRKAAPRYRYYYY